MRSRARSASRWSCGPPTCWAAARWRSCYDEEDLRTYMTHAVQVSNDSPVLLDRFLDVAIEVDVDAICDGEDVLIGGIMEHVEQAGVHSGDSGCSLPPHSLSPRGPGRDLRDRRASWPQALYVVGLMNIQFAIQNGVVYVLEVNPRASRTVPFVSKATGVPLAKIGSARHDRPQARRTRTRRRRARAAVLLGQGSRVPVQQVPGFGPDPRPRDEVHRRGHGHRAAPSARPTPRRRRPRGVTLPTRGVCLISVRDRDKPGAVELARRLVEQRLRDHRDPRHRQRRSKPRASPAGAPTRCAKAARTSST